ncbi:Calx-beta domain-containing protein [Nevskia ramosa]|uniref:Calx-beta domain-containing protein n=1 Tax=Nevskia ramosa TaxID=64002 RepID=UPI002352F936|nr:Calx-beta domain-containing protein [Nevskia ramosa]
MNFRYFFTVLFALLSFSASAQISLTSDRYAISSGNPQAVLQLQRLSSTGPATTIGYRTVSGSAIDGVDYAGTQTGTVTIPADSTAPVEIRVPLLFNGAGATRSFAVELTSVTGEESISRFIRADVQILGAADIQNNPGIFRLPIESASVSTTDVYSFSVSRENGSMGPASVRLVTRPGTGFQPIDQTLTWTAGEVGVRVVIVRATIPFEARTAPIPVTVDLLNATGAAVQGPGFFNVTFQSNLSAEPIERFLDPAPIFGAGTTSVSLLILRTLPAGLTQTERDEELAGYSYSVTGILNAVSGRDFEVQNGLAGPVEFNEGGVATIDVDILELANSDRQFQVEIFRFSRFVTRTLVTILGVANDPNYRPTADQTIGRFSFLSETLRFDNGVTQMQTFVNRSGASPLLPATIQYRLTPNDGVVGGDVDAEDSVGVISWTANGLGAMPIVFPLARTGQIPVRSFTLRLFELGDESRELASQQLIVNGTGGSPNANTVGFPAPSRQFPSDVSTVVTFVERLGVGTGAERVQYQIEDGNTVVGLDYPSSAAIGDVEWEDGEIGLKAITIPITSSNLFREKVFTLRVVGTNVSQFNSSQTIRVTGLAVNETTAGRIVFARAGQTVTTSLNNGTVIIGVERVGGTIGPATVGIEATYQDGTVRVVEARWAANESGIRSVAIPITTVGTVTLRLATVQGAVASPSTLTVEVGPADAGAGAFGWAILSFLGIAALLKRRKI